MNNNLRIIDANLNRLREGLRVIEEMARFVIESSHLSSRTKSIRHQLKMIGSNNQWHGEDLLNARDIIGDVGVKIKTKDEFVRGEMEDLLKANFCRVQESLRVLEEYSKLANKESGIFEKLRYEVYDIEKEMNAILKKNISSPICVLLTENLCKKPYLETVQDLVAAGATMIQLREKNKSDREFYQQVIATKQFIPKQVNLIINDRLDVALCSGANGVHLGEDEIPYQVVRESAPTSFIIGVTIHQAEKLESIDQTMIDYIGAGPFFETSTKPELKKNHNRELEKILTLAQKPIFAIGGISSKNINEVFKLGYERVAICSSIISQDQPALEYENIRKILETK